MLPLEEILDSTVRDTARCGTHPGRRAGLGPAGCLTLRGGAQHAAAAASWTLTQPATHCWQLPLGLTVIPTATARLPNAQSPYPQDAGGGRSAA